MAIVGAQELLFVRDNGATLGFAFGLLQMVQKICILCGMLLYFNFFDARANTSPAWYLFIFARSIPLPASLQGRVAVLAPRGGAPAAADASGPGGVPRVWPYCRRRHQLDQVKRPLMSGLRQSVDEPPTGSGGPRYLYDPCSH